MSGINSPRDAGAMAQPKQLTSRVMNMKFMQRAIATNKTRTPQSPSTPGSEPPLKRRRTGDYISENHTFSSGSTPTTPSYGDRTAISGALSAEADGSSISLGQRVFGSENNETEWVLDVNLPTPNGHYTTSHQNGQYSGESAEESEDEETHIWSSSTPSGRQTYGAFKRKKKTSTSTPQSLSKSAKRNADKSQKHSISDPDANADLSSGSNSDSEGSSQSSDSNSESESGSIPDDESNIYATSRKQAAQHKQKKGVDYTSKEATRKMDAMNYFDRGGNGGQGGLGRERKGLNMSGGGRSGNSQSGTPKHRSGNKLVGQDMFGGNKKKRKTM